MKKRGTITVFLTLMLCVLSAFVTALAVNVQKYVCKSEAEFAVDCAARSCFAEYDRDIYDKYHILLIDSSYLTQEGGIDRVEEHFSTYLANSLVSSELVEVSVSGTGACDLPEEVCADNCYKALTFTARMRSPSTGEYTITKNYAYDPEDI